MRSPINRHSIWQIAADSALVALAWWLAWILRFDQARPVYYDRYLDVTIIALVVAIKLPVFVFCGFYTRWWRYVSTRDMWTVVRGVVLASIAVFLVFTLFDVHRAAVPRGVWAMDLLLCLAFVAGSRLLARTVIERPLPGRGRGKDVVVVGAGDAGQLVIKEMQRNPALGYTPMGLLDDDPRKRNLRLHGVRVLGTIAELEHVVRDRRPDEVLIAIPSASGELRARIVETTRALRVPVKTLPSLADLVSGDADLARQLRPVEVEDVLGREPVEVDFASISDYLAGEVVLVTGAGGSIGSELCRQIARVGAGEAGPARQRRAGALRDRAGARPRAAVPRRRCRRRRRPRPGEAPPGLREVSAGRRLPCRRLQARGDDGGEPDRGGAQQHARHPRRGRRRRRVRRRALRPRLDGQGGEPAHGDGAVEGAREWIVETSGRRADVATRFVAVRFGNVLGSSGSVDADLPAADRARRARSRSPTPR